MPKVRYDPARHAATVSPPCNGAVFHQEGQDGKNYYFNAAHEPVNAMTGEVLDIEYSEKEPEVIVSEIVTVDEDGNKKFREVKTEVTTEKDPKEELKRWLMGQDGAETQWFTIRGYGKEVFGKIAPSKDELIGWAIDKNFVNKNDIKVKAS